MVIYCPNCNKVIKDTCGFCPHCGLRIYTQKEVDGMGIIHYPARFKREYSEADNANSQDSYEQDYADSQYGGNQYTEQQEAGQQSGYFAPQNNYAQQDSYENAPYGQGYDYNNSGYVQYDHRSGSQSRNIYIATILVLLIVIFAGAGYFLYSTDKSSSVGDYDYTETTNSQDEQSVDPVTDFDGTESSSSQFDQMMPEEGDEPITGAPVVEESRSITENADDGVVGDEDLSAEGATGETTEANQSAVEPSGNILDEKVNHINHEPPVTNQPEQNTTTPTTPSTPQQ